MGGVSSSNQNLTSYNKLTNSINVNATNEFVNSAVMDSLKKTLVSINQNCTQKFDSNAVLQLSNLSALGDVNLSNLSINSQNVVKFDCLIQSQVVSQTEDNFLSDNSTSIASMLQALGTSDFLQNISGSLKSKIDSMPLSFVNNNSNQSNTNIIDTTTSQNIVQNIQNLYKSTATTDTDMNTVASTYQAFTNQAKIQVTNVSAGGNINISAIRIDNINKFDSTAQLASAISNIIIQKMQSILGMKIEFQSSTSQSSSNNQATTSDSQNTSTLESATGVINNAVNGVLNLFNIPGKIILIFVGGFVTILVAYFLFSYLRHSVNKTDGRGIAIASETINNIIKNGIQYTQSDTSSIFNQMFY